MGPRQRPQVGPAAQHRLGASRARHLMRRHDRGVDPDRQLSASAAGRRVLDRVDLVRVNDRVLNLAATLSPLELRTLDAFHLATAARLGPDLGEVVTYDEQMAAAARSMGVKVSLPT